MKFLVKNGTADAFVMDNHNQTALHTTAENGHLDVVKFLVKRKPASMMDKDIEERIPLEVAKDHRVIEYLRHEMAERGKA